jgi:anti-repressor protein
VIDALAVTTNEAREGIDARQIHRTLGISRQFADWMPDQIGRLGLVQGRDFEVLHPNVKNPQGGRPSIEYAVSVSAAKLIVLSTQTRDEDARQAKADAIAKLIEIEERWNAPAAVMARALQMAHVELAKAKHAVESIVSRVRELEPKAEVFDRLTAARGDLNLREAAKALGMPPRQFNQALVTKGYLFYNRRGRLEPTAEYANRNIFRVRVAPVRADEDEQDFTRVQTLVTPAGLQWLAQRFAPRNPVMAPASLVLQ